VPLLADIRRIVPAVTDDRVLGPELGQLADHLTGEVLAEDCVEENTA
jgi:hypothetical protein